MNYFQIINEAIEYIEDQIRQPISLEQLAERAHMTRYHFIRIFKALTNKTPKEYIDARKLTDASMRLGQSGRNIVDIAMDYGFESHEVFTRRFRRFFGITPSEVKRGLKTISGQEKIEVVERDFTNRRNSLFPSYQLVQMSRQLLEGIKIAFDPEDSTQLRNVTVNVANFVEEYSRKQSLDRLYGVVCSSMGGRVQYFAGADTTGQFRPELEPLELPASQYAVFNYTGSMDGISDTVFADVCTALLISERQLNKTSVELFEVYDRYYAQTEKFSVYVPVK